ncbi:MAG: ATP-binding protein, partial [Chloroflexota bacterium]
MRARHLESSVRDALGDTPIVLIVGARQTGKSTLARRVADGNFYRYITLDLLQALSAARSDPVAFIEGFPGPVIIDEVQRAPELFLPLKAAVDRDRQPGRFLLTGSANVLLLPHLAETLVGRMEVLALWPFSQGEIDEQRERFIDVAFSDVATLPSSGAAERETVIRRILRGGYPEAVMRDSDARRGAWFAAYLETMLQREIPDLAQIEGIFALRQLLALIAARSPSLVNYAALSRDSGLPQTTL